MSRYIRARFEADPDTDGIGELFVEVSAPPFAGASSAWFAVSDLVRFAESLAAAYPLSAPEPIELRGGIFSENVKTIEQLLLGLSFYAVGLRGNVGCRVSLATPSSSRWPESRASLEAELLSTYEGVRSFALGILAIVQNHAKEALLAEDES